MNLQVDRVFELAKANAVIGAESKYRGYDQLTPPAQVDQEALEYCIGMGWVVRGDEYFPTGRITRLSLTVEGKTTLYEREHTKLAATREQPASESRESKLRTKRPGPRGKNEKDSAAKVLAALCKHHGYDNGSVTKYDAATNRGLAELVEGLAENALTRFLQDKRISHDKYKVACKRETIGGLLALWQGELPSHLPGLTDDELGRGRDD